MNNQMIVDELANELRQYRHSDMASAALAEHILAIPRIHDALAYNPDDRLTDEMIEAGANQMRAALNDGGWDDETVFMSALEAAGIDSALSPLPQGDT